MNDLFVILISTSICGNVVFGVFLLIKKALSYDYFDYIYVLMKIAGLFYLIPVTAICIYAIKRNSIYYETATALADFAYIKHYEGFKDWDVLLNNPYWKLIFFTVFAWLGGFIFFYIVDSVRGKLIINKITSHTLICESDMQILLQELKIELNVKRKIKLCHSNLIHTPMLIGIISPKIILPDINISNGDWNLLIKHELIHYKNHDLIFKSLAAVIQKLHWFNPVIYFYAKFFYETSELVCDQMTLNSATSKQRIRYAELLILLSANLPFEKAIATFSNNDYLIIEKRIRNIMKTQIYKKKRVVLLATMSLLMLCPTVSYASTWGTMYLQNSLINNVDEKRSKEVVGTDNNGTYKVMVDNEITSTDVTYMSDWSFRESNQIDCELTAKGEVRYSSVNLNVGSKVKLAISSENESDSFRAGIIDAKGTKKYVSSINGVITTELSISQAGTYDIYFQGMNTNNQSIHLYGFVNIN